MIKTQVVADSLSPQGDRLTSVLATFPRYILAEVNTHRMLSKNTSSSRAIPFKKMVETVANNPFIPTAFQKEHRGMQGNEYFEGGEHEQHKHNWLTMKDYAVAFAKTMGDNMLYPHLNVSKQIVNRPLEPYMWTTMLITGSEEGWDNFFFLRCPSYTFHNDEGEFVFRSKKDAIAHFGEDEVIEYEDGNKTLGILSELDWLKLNTGQAEIHMMAFAETVWDAMKESTPNKLKEGEWHIPFLDKMPEDVVKEGKVDWKTAVKIGTAMNARTSYTVVGEEKEINVEKLKGLHDTLVSQNPPHSSPAEHCAKVMTAKQHSSYKRVVNVEEDGTKVIEEGWCRNFKGFIQYRHIIETNGKI